MNHHASWLRWAVFAHNINREELASLFSVHPVTISQWMNGHNEPKEWRKIAKLLGITEAQYVAGPCTEVAVVVQYAPGSVITHCPLIARLAEPYTQSVLSSTEGVEG